MHETKTPENHDCTIISLKPAQTRGEGEKSGGRKLKPNAEDYAIGFGVGFYV